jgi:hypothetical protein
MAQKVFNLPESTSRAQTHIITIPGLKSISNISVNTGTAAVEKVEGDKVTIKLSGGSYSRRVQTGGSYTPADSKTVSAMRIVYMEDIAIAMQEVEYSSEGYTGTLYKTGYVKNKENTFTVSFLGTVTRPASDTRTYSNYYKYDVTIDYIANSPPTINGADENLGDKNVGFIISYQVDDVDTGDSLIVTEKLNGSILRTINGAPRKQDLEIEITNETLFSLELNSENTIEIKVDDGQGNIAYRRYTFRRTNTAPIISNQDEDLGQKLEPFSIDFSVSDMEGNPITVKIYINNVLKEEYQAEDGATNTFTISSEDWYKLGIGQHSIKIEAMDDHNAIAYRYYYFTRYDDKIEFTLKAPIETDIAATKILVTPTWVIPIGATTKVEVCNNGYDEVPTWEDITSQVITGKHYIFTNDVKTADKWGIDIRFTIEKGTATEECIIHGFGGAFE